ncbi:protein vestigial-like isoform X2 [Vespa mandarinia]|uniref:protein vestigial-like isoform X2 n=1 Tax=Vespa mandarinia TaxID=7446 RepID=UPI00160EC4AE|nr:protein vestigial-like isoform X2 [Vespa mandarinia]XP_046827452.1 protein vestigial isoform X2 [Vespa crabro]XP_047360069.1 protein vestigial isoform X2 [Vespa velutina]
MSCSEVMYQYYHPYLYSRAPPPPHPTHPHAAPHANPHAAHHSPARPAPFQPFSSATATHQYDRCPLRETSKNQLTSPFPGMTDFEETISNKLNVHQRSLEAAGLELCGGGGSVPQGQPSSAGSVGSAPSPASPRPTPQPRPPLATTTSQPSRTLDDDRSTDGAATAAEDSDDGESRAQYVSANCVVFTHYRGDAASEVEEHFQRALAHDKPKENISPMSMRNFPPSFWNSQHPSDVYEYPTDPWHAHYAPYQHRAVHEYHQHNMAAAASYSGLLLGSARGHHTSHHAAHHAAHHVHAAASYKDWTSATPSQSLVDVSSAPPYPHGPYASLSGLESQVQDSKDLYWF